MLRLLAASLKTAEDYKLFKRRHVVDLLTAFFNSQLSEPLSRKIVIEVKNYIIMQVALHAQFDENDSLWADNDAVLCLTHGFNRSCSMLLRSPRCRSS